MVTLILSNNISLFRILTLNYNHKVLKYIYKPLQNLYWLFMYSTGLVFVTAHYHNTRMFRKMDFRIYEKEYLKRLKF